MVAEWRACRSRHCNVELSKRRRSIGYCATCKPGAVQLGRPSEAVSADDVTRDVGEIMCKACGGFFRDTANYSKHRCQQIAGEHWLHLPANVTLTKLKMAPPPLLALWSQRCSIPVPSTPVSHQAFGLASQCLHRAICNRQQTPIIRMDALSVWKVGGANPFTVASGHRKWLWRGMGQTTASANGIQDQMANNKTVLHSLLRPWQLMHGVLIGSLLTMFEDNLSPQRPLSRCVAVSATHIAS